MNSSRRFLCIAVAPLALLLTLAFSAVAQASPYQVDTFADSASADSTSSNCVDQLDGHCSLRAAITAANNNPGADTITLPAGRYDRTIPSNGNNNDNETGDFNVLTSGGPLTIQGATGDAKDVVVSADGLDRVLEIDSGGTVVISGVTLQDGLVDGNDSSGNGGGILVSGGTTSTCDTSGQGTQTLTVIECAPQAKTTTTSLTLQNARVVKNVSPYNCGGGIYGEDTSLIVLTASHVDHNTAGDCGGGVGYEGFGSSLDMSDSSVDSNATTYGAGGGVYDASDSPASLQTSTHHASIPDTDTLRAVGSSISDNQSSSDSGGGIFNTDYENNGGNVDLSNTNVDHNFASGPGGGVYSEYGTVTGAGSTFDSNTSRDSSGGGIWNDGDGVTLTGSHVDGNLADTDGGGIASDYGPVSVDGGTVNNNTSRHNDGGGIAQDHCCILSSDNSNQQDSHRAIHQGPSDPNALTVSNSDVSNNYADDFGGGLYNEEGPVSVTGSTVTSNEARHNRGGGIYNSGSTTDVTDSHVDHNKTDVAQGGGIAQERNSGVLTLLRDSVDSNIAGADGNSGSNLGRGGGVYNNGSSGTFSKQGEQGPSIVDSSISRNHAFLSGGGLWDATGSKIVNTTIADNIADIAQDGHEGGGIFDHSSGNTLINVTLAGNVAVAGYGGGIFGNSGQPQLTNTIVADNQSNADLSQSDCGGTTPNSNGNNLDGVQSDQSTSPTDQCGLVAGTNGDQTKVDAKLGPLQDNGGPTLTRALLAGSPAIDNGNETVCQNNLTTLADPSEHDQRQAARPQGPACDVGAYEANALADLLVISKSASPNPVVVGNNVTYTIQVQNNGPDTALDAVVSDTLPGGVTFISDSASQGSCSGTATVTCHLGALASGATAQVQIVVRANAVGTLTNTASISSSATDGNTGNNSKTVQTSVVPAAAITPSQQQPKVPANCADHRKFKFHLHHARTAKVIQLTVYVNGKLKVSKSGKNITSFTLSRLKTGTFTVKIVALQNTGSTLTSVRHYKGCKKSRPKTTGHHVKHH